MDKCETTVNTQSRSLLEGINQVMPNLVCAFYFQNNYIDEYDPWSGIIADTTFVVQIMYHTKSKATSGQLMFGCKCPFHLLLGIY